MKKENQRYEQLKKIREAKLLLEYEEPKTRRTEYEEISQVFPEMKKIIKSLYYNKDISSKFLRNRFEETLTDAIYMQDNRTINKICLDISKIYTENEPIIQKEINKYAISHGINKVIKQYIRCTQKQ